MSNFVPKVINSACITATVFQMGFCLLHKRFQLAPVHFILTMLLQPLNLIPLQTFSRSKFRSSSICFYWSAHSSYFSIFLYLVSGVLSTHPANRGFWTHIILPPAHSSAELWHSVQITDYYFLL